MRNIHISDEKGRDAVVVLESRAAHGRLQHVLKDGSPPVSIRMVKASIENDYTALEQKFKTPEAVAEAIKNSDPEIDIELTGKMFESGMRVYVSGHELAAGVKLTQQIFGADGKEKEKRPLKEAQGNLNSEIALKWTGKYVPKDKAARMFAFTGKHQVRHIDGLTYDFLFNMAKTLEDKNSLVLIGGGVKGSDPVYLNDGGTPYRAFLEGRTDGQKYMLILHLTALELKEIAREN